MSYQVLARKWRPRFFREMVGQEHVLQALINALDHNRLHHAYLFTGTRGVGKTTIARILAKCLNCEVGVSSEPCGVCSSCTEIAQGSFVDLIEVDAASRTKVEDTRELLDNVQYAPSKGRFKVYLIDEVHMLSTHSFNALLKTLEEPPEHVKFLLATTDPQKLPPTILSRCLQFHLKNMSPEKISGHLQHVLTQEVMEFEEPALWSLARSAHGSMRDALSLTDQAIAFGTGRVTADSVSSMLGSIDLQTVYHLMQGLINYDAAALMAEVAKFSEHAPDYTAVLDELLLLLHRLTLAQVSADCVDNSEGDREKVIALAAQLSAEELQLFYQMGILGKRDIGLAPDLRTGFEMTLIRMLTFKPEGVKEPLQRDLPSSSVQTKQVVENSTTSDTGSQSGAHLQLTAPINPAEDSASEVIQDAVSTAEPLPVKKSEQGLNPAVNSSAVDSPAVKIQASGASDYMPKDAAAVVSVSSSTVSTVSKAESNLEVASQPVDDGDAPLPCLDTVDPSQALTEPAQQGKALVDQVKQAPPEPPAKLDADTAPSVPQVFNGSDGEGGDMNTQAVRNAVQLNQPEYAGAIEASVHTPSTVNNPPIDISADTALDTVVNVEADESLAQTLVSQVAPKQTGPSIAGVALPMDHQQWLNDFHKLPLQGLLKSIAAECVLDSAESSVGHIRINLLLHAARAQLFNQRQQVSLQGVLQDLTQDTLDLSIQPLDESVFEASACGRLTASEHDEQLKQLEQARVEAHIAKDPVLAAIASAFDAQIIDGSIQPISV